MSGRASPTDPEERGIPDDIYINPDNVLPPVSGLHIAQSDDILDLAPARGSSGKTSKLKGLFKRDKKGKDEPRPQSGALQLGDVLGKSGQTSSASSRNDGSRYDETGRVDAPKPMPFQQADLDKSRMSSFREFFKRKPEETAPVKYDDEMYSRTLDSMRTTVVNFFHGPPPPSAPTSPNADMEVAPLNPPPPRSPFRISIVMFVMFGLMVIIGIILIIVGAGGDPGADEHCKVLGPMFLLFGCFLIIGEVFFMMFFMENPMPCLQKCMAKINEKIGGIEDPYGLKRPETYRAERASYYPGLRLSRFLPPASPSAKESIPMKTMYSGKYDADYATGMTGPGVYGDDDGPSGPAALDYRPPGYNRTKSNDSSNTSYQNTSYQDDSFNGRII